MSDSAKSANLSELRELLEKAAVAAWGSQLIDFQDQLIKLGEHTLKLQARIEQLEMRLHN